MKKPAYKAKSGTTSSDKEKPKEKPKAKAEDEKPKAKPKSKPKDEDEEEEERPRKKPAAKAADDDEEDEQPKKKPAAKAAKKEEPLSLDDDDDEGGDSSRDGKIADSLSIDPGFKNKRLMKQVEAELSSGEVLHWAARPSMFLAKRKAGWVRIGGIVFAVIGAIAVAIVLVMSSKAGIPMVAALIPGLFVLVGIAIMILGPKTIIKHAENGWYAVTDRRAIVYSPPMFGSGRAATYEPGELRRMRVQKSGALEGGGSLIFKSITTQTTRTERDARGRTRTSTSTHTTHYGFLDIENVVEVETLVHKVLLGADDDDDDNDKEDDDE
jgi:hypothetical protein